MTEHEQRLTILSFEGPDKVGKSTLIREVNRAANYRFLCIDRFTGSAWVYDKLSGRRDRTDSISMAEGELSKLENVDVLNVLLSCAPEVLRERIRQEDEFSEARLEHLDQALEYYREYAQEIARLPIIEIDTTDKSVEDTVQEILSKVEAYEQSDNR
ncbi:hypothetical protein C4564_02770 [Candidatus Microgenomates bacterium]|nr:MAG: hypothetical protein C4564_02770 [Candidatus Microgenomates bacterium]